MPDPTLSQLLAEVDETYAAHERALAALRVYVIGADAQQGINRVTTIAAVLAETFQPLASNLRLPALFSDHLLIWGRPRGMDGGFQPSDLATVAFAEQMHKEVNQRRKVPDRKPEVRVELVPLFDLTTEDPEGYQWGPDKSAYGLDGKFRGAAIFGGGDARPSGMSLTGAKAASKGGSDAAAAPASRAR